MRARSGLEVEFTSDHGRRDVVERLENQGLVAFEEDYNHAIRDHWKVTTDSSCGYELVSPPLPPESAKSIAGAMRAVSEAGGYVNEQCGFHVHIEIPEGQRTYQDCLAIARLYHESYEFFSPVFEQSRLDNRFARFIENMESWMTAVGTDRYTAVNLTVLNRQPTVEFRQHQGTLSAKRAYSWMSLCDILTHTALEGGDKDLFIRRMRYDTPDEVADDLTSRGVAL